MKEKIFEMPIIEVIIIGNEDIIKTSTEGDLPYDENWI